MNSGTAFRRVLAEHLRNQAAWRAGKADEYPEDARNARSAAALEALAEHVERLPDTDANLRLLAAVHESYASDVFSPSEEGAALISRFGFDQEEPRDRFEQFLSQLASADTIEAVETDHEGDDDA